MPKKRIQNSELAVKWVQNDNAKNARNLFILKELSSGKSRQTIVEELKKNYNICNHTAVNYLNAAYNYLASTNKQYIEKLRSVQLQRLESIIENTMESGNYDTALRAIDLLNKTFALYEIKAEANITNNIIHFKFGDENFEVESKKNNDNAYFDKDKRNFSEAEIIEIDDIEKNGK